MKANDTCGEQSIPGWSAFNAEMSSITLPRTVIGYCLMIDGSPTEYSTIYTILKTVQEMSKQLHQSTAVITFDLVIYSKAKEIQWHYPEEFQDLVIGLGGFHIALNHLTIGKMFQESGLEDVFIEFGLYGSSLSMALLQGKSYNRGVKGHKLMTETLLRLHLQVFCSWIRKKGGVDNTEDRGGLNLDLVNSVMERYRAATLSEEKKEAYLVLCNSSSNCFQYIFNLASTTWTRPVPFSGCVLQRNYRDKRIGCKQKHEVNNTNIADSVAK